MENLPPGYFHVPQPVWSDGAGEVDKGPRDIMRDLENPDMLVPPTTDAGLIPNLRFSLYAYDLKSRGMVSGDYGS